MLGIFALKNLYAAIGVATALTASAAWADPVRGDKTPPAKAGGASAEHMSEKGSANTNSRNSTERATGQERAEERRSDHGADHNNAVDHDKNDKPGKKDRPPREKKH